MTVGSFPLAAGRRALSPDRQKAPSAPIERLPALFATTPLDPATALGRLFAADWHDRTAEEATALLGDWSPALQLLPARERRRSALVAVWVDALATTAAEGDRAERRIERLNRSAFLLAKALAGQPSSSPFAAALAAESAARLLPRRALDLLLAATRAAIAAPRPADLPEWRDRARAWGGACAEALLGQEPSAATVDAAAALFRLALLVRLPAALARGRSHLHSAPGGDETTVATVAEEIEDLRAQLLRGARALAEVPLGYRRALAFLTTAALDLVGRVEDRPEELLVRAPQVGWWRRRISLWRARRTPL